MNQQYSPGTLLRDGWLWLTLLGALLILVVAYTRPVDATLHVGGDRQTRLRYFDTPFLYNVHDSEPDGPGLDWPTAPQLPYRWTEPESAVRIPALGTGTWLLQLAANSGPAGSIPLTITDGTGSVQALSLEPRPRTFWLLANSTSLGDLVVHLRAPRLEAPNDPRSLGFVLQRVHVAPLAGAARAPALGQLAILLVWCILAYCMLRLAGLAAPWSSLVTLVLALGLAWFLVQDRLGLTAVTSILGWLALVFVPLVALTIRALGQVVPQAAPAELAQVVGLGAAAFIARMVGVLHPYTRFSDLGFHVNNVAARLTRGQVFLTGGLPCEAGAGNAPYPPAQYLVLAPFQLLFDPTARTQIEWLVQGGSALFEGLGGVIAIWLLMRRLGYRQVAAVCAAVLYVLPAPILRAYNIGEMANLFAQGFVPWFMLLLATWPPARRSWRWVAGAFMTMLLLSHTGVTISATCLGLAWFGMRLVRDRYGLGTMILLAGLAGILAVAVFYSAFLYLPAENRLAAEALLAQGQRCPPGKPLLERLLGTLDLGFGSASGIALPLAVVALAGLLGYARGRMAELLWAALIGTLCSLATLLNTDQPVRWVHFVYPAFCLAAGLALGAWWQRGRAGRWSVLILCALLLWQAGANWMHQIAEYLH